MFSGFYYYCYSTLALALGRRLKVGRPSGVRSSTASPLGGYLQSLVKRAAITTWRTPSLHAFRHTMLQGAGRLLPHSSCRQKSPLRERRDCGGVGLVQRPTGVSQPPFRKHALVWAGRAELPRPPFVLAESSSAFLASGKVDDYKKNRHTNAYSSSSR